MRNDGEKIIYPGEADTWWDFTLPGNIEALRILAVKATQEDAGVRLIGDVGLTSHRCDILRMARVPSRLCRNL